MTEIKEEVKDEVKEIDSPKSHDRKSKKNEDCVKCEVCGKDITKSNFSTHKRSAFHMKAMADKQMNKISPPKPNEFNTLLALVKEIFDSLEDLHDKVNLIIGEDEEDNDLPEDDVEYKVRDKLYSA